MLTWRRAFLVIMVLTTLAQKAISDVDPSIKDLLSKAYQTGHLTSVEKGNFTGSGDDEYLAFYERLFAPGDKYSAKEVWGVVFAVRNDQIVKAFDLRKNGLSTIGYDALHLKTVQSPTIHFGRWARYAYVGDYNGNGLDEILFFQLTGMSFLPVVIEFNGKEFVTVLTFETPRGIVSELDTVTQNRKKLLKIYGSGSDYAPAGKRDWAVYEWDQKTDRYEVIEQGSE